MKEMLLAIIAGIMTPYVYGQNVGIGTTNPGDKLHVAGSGNVIVRVESSNPSGFQGLEFRDDYSGITRFQKYNSSTSGTIAGFNMADLTVLNAAGALLIGTTDAAPVRFMTGLTPRMLLNSDGNVGINTLSPAGKLHVEAGGVTSVFSDNAPGSNRSTVTVSRGGSIGVSPYTAALHAESPVSPAGYFASNSVDVMHVIGYSSEVFSNGDAYGSFHVGQAGTVTNSAIALFTSGGPGSGIVVNKTGTAGDGIKVEVASIGQSGIYSLNKSLFGGFGIAAQSYSGVSIYGAKSYTDVGQSGLFENLNASNISPTVEITSNGSGSKLLINDNSTSVNASLQVNTQAGNGVRIARTGGPGNGFYVDNSSTGGSSGVVALNYLNSPGGVQSYGVLGVSGTDGSGTYPIIGTNIGVLGINMSPTNGYGLWGSNHSTGPGAGVVAEYAGTGTGTALQISNGNIKVTGTNKPAFIHVATVSNTSSHITTLNYAGASSTDMLIITPNYSTNNIYNNHPTGVYWNGTAWAIFNQDFVAMPIGAAFNVLVIKQ